MDQVLVGKQASFRSLQSSANHSPCSPYLNALPSCRDNQEPMNTSSPASIYKQLHSLYQQVITGQKRMGEHSKRCAHLRQESRAQTIPIKGFMDKNWWCHNVRAEHFLHYINTYIYIYWLTTLLIGISEVWRHLQALSCRNLTTWTFWLKADALVESAFHFCSL